MYRSLLLALSLLFAITTTKAAVFVVTSNADSGPGTLRESLTLAAANGSTEKDYINFNLPDLSEAGRTIILESELPYCSSNLLIDGSTQNGAKIKMSDAKIAITVDWQNYIVPLYESAAFTLRGVDKIEIYGLFISGFLNLRNNFPSSGSIINAGILIHNSKNIIIGAPGKGNIFGGNLYSIYGDQTDYSTHDFPSDVTVQSNFLGYLKDDGNYLIEGTIFIGDNFTFGGDTPEKGNYMLGPLLLGLNNAVVTNNYFGLDKNKQLIRPNNIDTLYPIIEGGPNNALIANNLTSLLLIDLNGATNFKIISNTCISPIGIGIQLSNCENGTIGTDDLSLQNTLSVGSINTTGCKNIEVRKNSIRCTALPFKIYSPATTIPDIQINVNNDDEFSGSASPNSDVYIYNDNTDCDVCNPVEFYKQVVSDASGQWKITGAFSGKKLLANATLNKNSSEYTLPFITADATAAIGPTCGINNGSIKVLSTKNVLKIEWFDSNDKKVGEGAEIKNLGPGIYYAKGSNNRCSAKTQTVYLYDYTPQIDDSYKEVKNPACSSGGSISQLYLNTDYGHKKTYTWRDKNKKIVGNDIDVYDLSSGEYTLTVNIDESNCSLSYGPIKLKKTTGATIDDSKPDITNTNCGQAIGSIKNIIIAGGTGTQHFVWKNNQQQEVGYTRDLTGQPAGKYTLQVTDGSSCGPVYSKEIEIVEVNGITIIESTTPATPASCGKANGRVTGLAATGGTKYEWRDVNGNLVGTSLDLSNVPGGGYQLTVSNAFCQKQSKIYQVVEQPGTIFPSTYTVSHTDACYGAANGALQVTADALVKSVRWTNNAGGPAGMGNNATGLPAGSYKLYLTDEKGCESYYNTYQVTELPAYTVADRGQTSDESCGLKNGAVNNVIITGGLPPYTYKWLDAGGTQIGSTNSIPGLAAGSYTLNVVDSRCGNVDIPYVIQNIPTDLPAPAVSDLQVCSPGDVLLFVNNPVAGGVYRIYDQLNSASPLAEQAGGSFKLHVTVSRSFFVSRVNGTCESAHVEVKVSVGLSPVNIANTFSPNADGFNDYWKIAGIENYTGALVQIFNRNGQKVFESKGYAQPFYGTYNNKPLPVGTYYYIINLNKNCRLLSGSLTIIR